MRRAVKLVLVKEGEEFYNYLSAITGGPYGCIWQAVEGDYIVDDLSSGVFLRNVPGVTVITDREACKVYVNDH